jgi:cytoplasmic iron level regulating protein YaaA (DUF328/UPF0246 family)
MLLIVSPAKSLDFETTDFKEFSQPELLDQSEVLVDQLKGFKEEEIGKLMKLSDKLAKLNYDRYQEFQTPFSLDNAKQAVLAFKGDVYKGLGAEDFSEEELAFAQDHLRILSGLYGVLRPLDLMQAYRLEMGTRMQNERGKNLYEFWDGRITDQLNEALADSGEAIVNLASNEYWSAVKLDELKAPVYNIHFKEKRGDQYKIISFSAKKARGLMCRYAIKNRLTEVEDLKKFDLEDYRFNEGMSSEMEWTFTR